MRALLLVLALICVSFAQEPEPAAPSEPSDELGPYAEYIGLGTCIVAIVVGLLWVFFGYRFINISLAMAGFIVLFFVAYQMSSSYVIGLHPSWLHYVIGAGAGLCGALLFYCLRQLGYFLFGFFIGAVISSTVLGATPLVSLFTSGLIPLIVILVTGLVFAFAILFEIFQRHLLIFGTSFNGAFLVGTAVDTLLLHTAFSDLLVTVLTDFYFHNAPAISDDWKPYTLLAGLVVLGLVGMLVQYKFTAVNTHHDQKKKKKSDEELSLVADSPYNY